MRTFAAVLAWIVFGAAGCSQQGGSRVRQTPDPPPQVVVAEVASRTVPNIAEYVGQTQSVDTVEIRSQVTGFLQEVAFDDGSRVEAGQLLFTIDPRPYQAELTQAQASLDQYLAGLHQAERDVNRYRPLVERHAVSQEQLDTATAAQEEAQANVEAARARISTAELNLGFTRITAPMSGQIGPSLVKVGALIQNGSTLLDTIYSIDPIYVTFNVAETDYLKYPGRFTLASESGSAPVHLMLADGQSYPQTGRIDMIAPDVDPNTGTLAVRAVLANPKMLLKPGLFVRVLITLSEQKNALLVPQPAVQELQGTQSVQVVGPDNKVQFRNVTVEGATSNSVIISSGLKAGERVIVEGLQKVRPGMVVEPVQQTPSPASAQNAAGSNAQTQSDTSADER